MKSLFLRIIVPKQAAEPFEYCSTWPSRSQDRSVSALPSPFADKNIGKHLLKVHFCALPETRKDNHPPPKDTAPGAGRNDVCIACT